MRDSRQPFDVNTLLGDLDEAGIETSHDSFGTRPSPISSPERIYGRENSTGSAPRSTNPPEAVQEARPPIAIEEILTERGKTHGDFADHATITQFIKRVMRTGKNWEALSDMQKESLEMNAHKIGRILSGNPDHQDHWDDIAGYAKLISQRL